MDDPVIPLRFGDARPAAVEEIERRIDRLAVGAFGGGRQIGATLPGGFDGGLKRGIGHGPEISLKTVGSVARRTREVNARINNRNGMWTVLCGLPSELHMQKYGLLRHSPELVAALEKDTDVKRITPEKQLGETVIPGAQAPGWTWPSR
jgi:hypothetical protein